MEKGKNVVLVMHSYGGIAGTNAVSGLEAELRREEGKEGGVVHCLFVAAFLVPKGKSLLGMFPERPPYQIPDGMLSVPSRLTTFPLILIRVVGREIRLT